MVWQAVPVPAPTTPPVPAPIRPVPPSPVRYVLFPGRHHLVTSFQVDYLTALVAGQVSDTEGVPVVCAPDVQVVWAVTSATHSGTRRNPVPAHRREAMVERVTTVAGLPSLVVPVADVPQSPRFAHTVVATVEAGLGVLLSPADTVVACSTPAVAEQYAAEGFRVAAVEAGDPGDPARPWDVLEMLATGDPRWRDLAHPQAVEVVDRYHLDELVRRVHDDPTVSAEGDLTATRDYGTYTADFDAGSDRKWAQVGPYVQPGRVVDLGCAAGGLLERAARDPRLGESDLYGVDVSRHLVAEAEHRKAQGVFENPNVLFAQRNLLSGAVFAPASVDTTLTVALTHEISSYGAGTDDLRLLADRIFEHTVPGGVWVCSDVLGPADGDRLVRLTFEGAGAGAGLEDTSAARDGTTPAGDTSPDLTVDLTGRDADDVRAYLASLSPAGRLRQFARDFPALSGGACDVTWLSPTVAELTLRAAAEFLYTRDYTDSYLSECHERFCDLTFDDWTALLTGAGFEVDPVSHPWRNDWLVENRLSVGVTLTDAETGSLVDWPDTHVLLVARRPLHAAG